jgi:molybdate transport system substrate-binding protein
MRTALLTLAVMVIALGAPRGVAAAEIKVLTAGAFKQVLLAVLPEFEKQTGHKVTVENDTVGALRNRIESGEVFDVAVLTPAAVNDLASKGKLVSGSRANLARVGVGVMVKAGAPVPDIGSVEAFRQTLLKAKSIAHSKEGASGVYFMGLLDRLGIAAQVKPKLIGSPAGAGGLVSPVVKGEAEMVVGTTSAIMDGGVELVGPIPNELQHWTTFTAGIAAASTDATAAQSLVRFLTAPGAVAAIKAKGMEPLGK